MYKFSIYDDNQFKYTSPEEGVYKFLIYNNNQLKYTLPKWES